MYEEANHEGSFGRAEPGIALLASTVSAETLTDKVVVVAGNQPVKVRLADIDAPELKQPYGQKSK